MIPLEKVKDILDKHAKLEVDLSSADIDKFLKITQLRVSEK